MLELRVLSPITKVFPLDAPRPTRHAAGLLSKVVSFPRCYRRTLKATPARPHLRLEIASPVRASRAPRKVHAGPDGALPDADDNYLAGKKPGLYPDALIEIPRTGCARCRGSGARSGLTSRRKISLTPANTPPASA